IPGGTKYRRGLLRPGSFPYLRPAFTCGPRRFQPMNILNTHPMLTLRFTHRTTGRGTRYLTGAAFCILMLLSSCMKEIPGPAGAAAPEQDGQRKPSTEAERNTVRQLKEI